LHELAGSHHAAWRFTARTNFIHTEDALPVADMTLHFWNHDP